MMNVKMKVMMMLILLCLRGFDYGRTDRQIVESLSGLKKYPLPLLNQVSAETDIGSTAAVSCIA